MRKSTVLLYDLARALYGAAVFYWFFMFLILIFELQGVKLSPAVPVLAMAAVYAAGFIATGRGIGFWQYAGLQAVVTAAGTVFLICCLGLGESDTRLKVFAAADLIIASIVAAIASSSEVKPGSLTIRFDCCVLMCTIILIAGHYTDMPLLPYCVALLLLAMAAIAVTLTVMRAEDHEGVQSAAGRVLPFVLLAIIGLFSMTAYLFAAGGAKKLTEAIAAAFKAAAHAIGAALAFIWTQWTRFCAWLATLFPDRDIVPDPLTPEQQSMPDIPQPTEPSRFAVILVWVLTALVAVAFLVAVYFALRNIRLKRKGRLRFNNRKAVRRGGLLEGLKAAFSMLKEKLRYSFACIRYRNTPAGLLAWCESKVPRSDRCRKGESGPGFLLRIADGREEAEKTALTGLASLVERDFYSAEKTAVPPELKAAVKRCRF